LENEGSMSIASTSIYIFCYFCKMNCEDDKFTHSPSFSFNEVKQLLVQAQIIIVNSYNVLQMYNT
jgi:adenine specific DNA methylase Mod